MMIIMFRYCTSISQVHYVCHRDATKCWSSCSCWPCLSIHKHSS
jgi:hypothetical protein